MDSQKDKWRSPAFVNKPLPFFAQKQQYSSLKGHVHFPFPRGKSHHLRPTESLAICPVNVWKDSGKWPLTPHPPKKKRCWSGFRLNDITVSVADHPQLFWGGSSKSYETFTTPKYKMDGYSCSKYLGICIVHSGERLDFQRKQPGWRSKQAYLHTACLWDVCDTLWHHTWLKKHMCVDEMVERMRTMYWQSYWLSTQNFTCWS